MPCPRWPGRTRMHHTLQTPSSSPTCGMRRFVAKLVSARGWTAAQPTTSSPSYASTPGGPDAISSRTFAPRASPRSSRFSALRVRR